MLSYATLVGNDDSFINSRPLYGKVCNNSDDFIINTRPLYVKITNISKQVMMIHLLIPDFYMLKYATITVNVDSFTN